MTSAAVLYLERFQAEFSAMLRGPLDRSTGTLRARSQDYPPDLVGRVRAAGVDPRERLAIYNRQYWFRLFGVLQQDHRLTVALVGAWAFNELASQFLLAKPPVGHDLGTVTEGFADFARGAIGASGLEVHGRRVPPQAIVEALAIDLAFRTAALAVVEPPLRLAPADAARLPNAQLVWSRSLTLVEERWPLIEMRQRLPSIVDDTVLALAAPHQAGPATWVIHRTAQGLHARPLDSAHAELLRLLRTHSIGEALAILEAQRSSHEIVARVQQWFAADLAQGFWTGLGGRR